MLMFYVNFLSIYFCLQICINCYKVQHGQDVGSFSVLMDLEILVRYKKQRKSSCR